MSKARPRPKLKPPSQHPDSKRVHFRIWHVTSLPSPRRACERPDLPGSLARSSSSLLGSCPCVSIRTEEEIMGCPPCAYPVGGE